MATLTEQQKDEVFEDAMRRYSHLRREVPFSKAQFRAFFDIVDPEMEAAEIAVVQAVPVGDMRQWLIDNDDIGRDLMMLIEEKRREVL
jgi:uncharacterized protein (DUF2236 family)